MRADELVKLAEDLGATVTPIRKHCQFQGMDRNVFHYCQRQQEFGINLGSAGGPAIQCTNHSIACGSHSIERPNEEWQLMVMEYTDPKTCPFYIDDGEIMGWEILLPKEATNETLET